MSSRIPDHVLDNWSAGGPSVGRMKGVVFGTSSDRERHEEYLRHFFKDASPFKRLERMETKLAAKSHRESAEAVASGRTVENGHSLAALASKARSCAEIIQPDIIQTNQGAIVAQGAAILEQTHRSEDLIQRHS